MMFYMFRDNNGHWRWRLLTARHEVLADCAFAYPRKEDCRAAIQLVKNCQIARVHVKQLENCPVLLKHRTRSDLQELAPCGDKQDVSPPGSEHALLM